MHRDAGAAVDSGNDFYRALVQLSDAQHQSQTQPGPIRSATLLQSAEEAVKCTSLALLSESGAVISNRDGHTIVNVLDVDHNPSACEAQRIVKQVSQGDRECIFVARHNRVVGRGSLCEFPEVRRSP